MSRSAVHALAAALFALGLLFSGRDVLGGERGKDALAEAERAEAELRFADAERAFAELARSERGTRLSRRAEARLEWLRARKAGGYAPLREMERIRRDSTVTPEALAALEARIPTFPDALLRREARALVADGYLRVDRPMEAVRAHEAWLAEPNLPDADWVRAANGLALARSRLGDLGGALDTLRARGLGRSVEAAQTRLALLARWARPLALGLLMLLVLSALALGARRGLPRASLSRAFSPARVLVAAWLLGVPLLLALLHRPETWRSMRLLAPGVALVLALAALLGALLEGRARRERAVFAVMAVVAQLAVGYLCLDASGVLLSFVVAAQGG